MKIREDGKHGSNHTGSHRCHNGPVQVIENLFCGSEGECMAVLKAQACVDTLVPLYMLEADIWEWGFRGEILYYPIKDYGILPDDVLDEVVAKIIDRLSQNKRVLLFCMGGHGRTGYVASVVLGKLGYEDPIGYLRSTYCRQAVESNEQVRQIAGILGKPDMAEHYLTGLTRISFLDDFGYYEFGAGDTFIEVPSVLVASGLTCGGCGYFHHRVCLLFEERSTDADAAACSEFWCDEEELADYDTD